MEKKEKSVKEQVKEAIEEKQDEEAKIYLCFILAGIFVIAGTVILMLELSQVLGIVAIVLGVLEFVASFALRNKKASTILTWINFILLIAFVVIYFYLDSQA